VTAAKTGNSNLRSASLAARLRRRTVIVSHHAIKEENSMASGKVTQLHTEPDAPQLEPAPAATPADGKHAVETEVDPVTAISKIAPITVGNPLDAASLAIDQDHLEELADPDAKFSVVECRRPPKGRFFTVRPESQKPWRDRRYYWMLQMEGRDPYIVAPAIAEKKKDEEDTIRPVLLVRYVMMDGEEGLWPVKLNPPDGKSNAWNTSALNILALAEKGWVRIVSMKKSYRHQVSNKTLEEVPPQFSDRSFDELVKAAFQDDQIVISLDHQIWDDLANGSKK